jgi:AraC-like DNA-binding protein
MVVYAPLAGSVDVASRRGDIWLRPGQFGVMPTMEPVDVRISGRARTLTAFLSCGPLEGIDPAAALAARALSANPAYQLFVQHLRLTLQLGPSLDRHASAAASAASQLLAAALTSADAQAAPCHDVVRIAQLKDYIDRSLANPSLSAAQVGAANFVSERTVQRLFHATGETVSGYIRRRRLENCRADILANPALPIGEICLRWGLPDGSHLARQFRAQFGEPPQQIRALAGTEAKPGATGVSPAG